MTESFRSTLIECSEKMGLKLTGTQIDALYKFYETVLYHNKTVNLTAITDEKDFVVKHIADSLSAEEFLPAGACVCDIGPGAGFPSVPLKIVRDDLRFVLIEASGKRVRFLERAIRDLSLDRIEAVHARAENAGRGQYRGFFDRAVSRAVGRTAALLEIAVPMLKKDGLFIGYAGRITDAPGETDAAAKILGAEHVRTKHFFLPLDIGERNLLVFRKVSDTPERFPRTAAAIRKRPL